MKNFSKAFLLFFILVFCQNLSIRAVTSVKAAPATQVAKPAVKPIIQPAKTMQTSSMQVQTPSTVQPQPIDFSQCSKYYKIDGQKLFYLSLASANANRFIIDEIQSKSGYILFTAAKRQFLASVVSIDSKNSMIKITPTDNNYLFPIGIIQNFFKYIELNADTQVEKLIVQ